MRENSSLCTTLMMLNCRTTHHTISRHCPGSPLICAGLHVCSGLCSSIEHSIGAGRLEVQP